MAARAAAGSVCQSSTATRVPMTAASCLNQAAFAAGTGWQNSTSRLSSQAGMWGAGARRMGV